MIKIDKKAMPSSLLRHVLTALGILVTALGINSLVPVIDYLILMFDDIHEAIMILIGVVTTIIGFFTKRNNNPQDQPDEV